MTDASQSPRRIALGALVALFACLVLASCGSGGGPSVDDIKSAANSYIDRAFGPWSPLNNHARAQEVKDVSCAPANGKPGFLCTYDLIVLDPAKSGPSDQGKATSRFVKDGDKWTLMKDR